MIRSSIGKCLSLLKNWWSPDQRDVAAAWKIKVFRYSQYLALFLFLSLTSVPAQWAMLRSLYLTQQLLTIKSSRLVSRRLWMMSDQGQPLTFASFSSAKSVLTMNTANQGMTATDNEAQQHCPSFQSHPNICRTTDRHYCLVLAILAIDWPWPITMVFLFFFLKRRHWKLFGNTSYECNSHPITVSGSHPRTAVLSFDRWLGQFVGVHFPLRRCNINSNHLLTGQTICW